MSRSTPLTVAALFLLAANLAADAARAAKRPLNLELARGARIGVVSVLDADVTHFHTSHRLQDSFLMTYPLAWPVNAMLLAAVREPLTKLGLVAVPVSASAELRRARESCFLDVALARGLPKTCGPPFAQLAGATHLDAIIVLGPGRNDSAHAAGTRHRELPEYLRGWCFVSGEGGAAPTLLSLTELLLIGVSGKGVELADREWGGDAHRWTGYTPPADLKAIPRQQLDQLQPLFGAMLQEQAAALLAHLQVAH